MAFPIFFRAMTPFRGTAQPSKKTTVETAPVIAPAAVSSPSPSPFASASASPVVATPASLPPTADAASTIAAAASSAPVCVSACEPASAYASASVSASVMPLRSLVGRATDHAVIFVSTFLFGDAAWGNGHEDDATAAFVATPRVAIQYASGDRIRHRRSRGLRGVKTFKPSLPSIGEDSTTIAVDEAELQQVRAARLVRFDLRMLARSGSFDDDDEDDEDDDTEEGEEAHDDEDHEENDANEEAVEEKTEENDTNEPLVNDPPELQENVVEHQHEEQNDGEDKNDKNEQDEEVKIKNDVPVYEPVPIDQEETNADAADNEHDDAAARVGEEEDGGVAGHHVHPATGVCNFAHIDLLGNLIIDNNTANAATSAIQRCFRHWMDMKIERLVRELLGGFTNDGDKDDASTATATASRRSSTSDVSSAYSTCTTVSSSTSSTSTFTSSTSSLHRRSSCSTNAKPKVDSNNGTKRVRQYPISAATHTRRATQTKQQAELVTQRQLDTDRIAAVKAKVQSFNGGTKRRTAPSALQLADRAIQVHNDAENAIQDARLAVVKPVVGSNNNGKRPQRVSRQRSTPDVNDAAIKRETNALEERVRSVQPKVNSHRPRPRKQQQQ